jgi:hypothetical protein
MVRFGIVRAEQFRSRPKGLLGRLRTGLTSHRISFQLLKDPIASADDSDLFDKLMSMIRLSSGVNRTTFQKRFADLDGAVNTFLMTRFGVDAPLDVHDWAASDCITSVEWAHTLLAVFPNARLTASDLALYLLEVFCPGGAVFIAERDCEPLQYIVGAFVIRLNPPEPKLLVLNYLLGRHAMRKFPRVRGRISPAVEYLDRGEGSVELPPYRVNRISLVHPRAASLQQRDLRFRIQRHSVFDCLQQPADVIRSMNIFNRAYFASERLAQGVRAVAESLKPGGIWIVGRTGSPGQADLAVSILENTPRGFRLLQRFGGASDIEDLALQSSVPQ